MIYVLLSALIIARAALTKLNPAMRFALIILLVLTPLLSQATVPIQQPLPEAFADFQKNYPTKCDGLIKIVRNRIGATKEKKIKERFEHLSRYRNNLGADIVEAQRALSDPEHSTVLAFTLHKICTDLVGFRRSFDALLIEAVATKAISLDDDLLLEVRAFWNDEYYFSWRFGSEIAPRHK